MNIEERNALVWALAKLDGCYRDSRVMVRRGHSDPCDTARRNIRHYEALQKLAVTNGVQVFFEGKEITV